ncbi:hypothetical protein HELRODRAFT_171530 [Helobdella robusta]|uniref:Uncharacterized protein n=1 Tax=Helobdella robusta TaxID=6412 RepID=T1F4D9_HELRO|nr:hypothetical protein HELRODRAFT_171530 [Helobdella robusta]ESO05190.1 hypothetical protein HELRODRAFT_171530 [Helobdella robusta]
MLRLILVLAVVAAVSCNKDLFKEYQQKCLNQPLYTTGKLAGKCPEGTNYSLKENKPSVRFFFNQDSKGCQAFVHLPCAEQPSVNFFKTAEYCLLACTEYDASNRLHLIRVNLRSILCPLPVKREEQQTISSRNPSSNIKLGFTSK